MHALLILATSLAALSVSGTAIAAPEIVRCVAPGGSVTYQHAACPDSSTPQRTAIPTEFPPQNLAERERILEREEAFYRRLEARRDRELQEAQMREARAEREAERERLAALLAAQTAQPQYVIAYPLQIWRPQPLRRVVPPAVRAGREARQ